MPPKGWNVPKHYTGDDVKGLVAWLQRVLRDLKTFFSYVPTYNDRKTELEITGNIIMQPGATVDGVDISEIDLNPPEPISDHGELEGLADDDHTQYSRVDGTRPFTGPVGGVPPTNDDHLTTKLYVDAKIADEIGNIPPPDLEGVVRDDGSTPFLAPQVGVDPSEDNHLVTKRALDLAKTGTVKFDSTYRVGLSLSGAETAGGTMQNLHLYGTDKWICPTSSYHLRMYEDIPGGSPNVTVLEPPVDTPTSVIGGKPAPGWDGHPDYVWYNIAPKQDVASTSAFTRWYLDGTTPADVVVFTRDAALAAMDSSTPANALISHTVVNMPPDGKGFWAVGNKGIFYVDTENQEVQLKIRADNTTLAPQGHTDLTRLDFGLEYPNSDCNTPFFYHQGYIYGVWRHRTNPNPNDGVSGIYRFPVADPSYANLERVCGAGWGTKGYPNSYPATKDTFRVGWGTTFLGIWGDTIVAMERGSFRWEEYPEPIRELSDSWSRGLAISIETGSVIRIWSSDPWSAVGTGPTAFRMNYHPGQVTASGGVMVCNFRRTNSTRVLAAWPFTISRVLGSLRDIPQMVYWDQAVGSADIPATSDELLSFSTGKIGVYGAPALVDVTATITCEDAVAAGALQAEVHINDAPASVYPVAQSTDNAPASVTVRAVAEVPINTAGDVKVSIHGCVDGAVSDSAGQVRYSVVVWRL